MPDSSEKIRILILTSATGGGHNARAFAIKDWIEKLYPNKAEIKIEELIENSASIGKLGVFLCNFIDMVAPIVHYAYWFIIELAGQINRIHLLFGKKYYKALLQEYWPHLIISVHDFLNCGYFETARKVLGPDKVNCLTYCGEFSGGFGYSINWVNTSADLFIARNKEALEFAHKLGIDPKKSTTFCSLLAPKDYEERLSVEEIKSFRQKVLKLDPQKFTVFLATGRNGQNNHIAFLNILKQYAPEVQAIAICGKNNKAYQELEKWEAKNPQFCLYKERYSTQVHKLIQSSNVIVTRGGANTAAKALFYGCPILFNCIQGKMPQERLTINYFTKHKAARILRKNKDFKQVLLEWKNFGEEYQETLLNMQCLQPQDEPIEELFHQLLDLIVEKQRNNIPTPALT